ncbi:MAG: ABC transporter permease [Candidatus Heimdallarchaeaceae archaeon]
MRSLLTILSIVVGAFLISIMMSVGQGLEEFLLSQVTTFSGEESISVSQEMGMLGMLGIGGSPQEYEETDQNDFADSSEMIEQRLLDKEDLKKIKNIDGVKDAGFQIIIQSDFIQIDGEDSKKFNINLYGFPSALTQNIRYYDVDYDLLGEENSIVLSGDFAESWDFTNDKMVGKNVEIQISKETQIPGSEAESKLFSFIVAGVTEKSLIGQMGMIGTNSSYEIGAYRKGITVEQYGDQLEEFEIAVLVENVDLVDEVDKAIEELEYRSITLDEAIGQIGTVFDIIGYVLSGFGGIALFVASIGIANTLLMAIYERTREIGVMMAVGAKKVFIGIMFTFEGALLGFMGGILGLLASWGFGRISNNVLHNGIMIGENQILDAYLADYPTFDVSIITPWLAGFVIITTTVVAWVASIYPAWKASNLDPIKALRHD